MKKFKKMFAVLLAVAAVCALMTAPASASTSDSASGRGVNYSWSSSLVRNGNSATARTVVTANPSGSIPAYLSAEVSGYIFDLNGGFSVFSDDSGLVSGQTAIAVATGSKAGAVSAECNCYVQDSFVAYLTVN